ncbi:hypothetical protein FQR65_LT04730 [Abscondita terminalis]|nr:hypothetical protein FQR65_LT04730 [Abscondita terminalis]
MNDSLEDYIHFVSDSPQPLGKTDASKDRILLTLQKKKECETRAMKTLEFLIEGKIRAEVFFRCINHLNRSYYADVVEERSITRLCGYCMCGKKIPTMPAKQYAIDSKHNKVYDVTNRKKFCSDYCYKASNHIEKQIDDSPLWLRDSHDFPKYTLLPATDQGIPGEDLSSDLVTEKDQIPFQSAYSFVEVALQELTKEKPKEPQVPEPTTNIPVKENSVFSEEKPQVKDIEDKPKLITNKLNKGTKVKRKNKIQLIKQYVLEWLTPETYVFLFGDEKVKAVLTQLDLSHISQVSVIQKKELAQLCDRLNLLDCIENKLERTLLDKQLKPVPSYKQIKKENKDINIKVRSFYGGSSYEVDGKEESDIIPVGDSPNVIRQNVFLNSIKNAMKVLSENLDIPWVLVLKQLEALVKTFALQPHSVVFQPVEWNLIALILMKMLSLHDASIREQLSSTKSQTFMNSSVSPFPGIQTMLIELFSSIDDIETYLKKHFCV